MTTPDQFIKFSKYLLKSDGDKDLINRTSINRAYIGAFLHVRQKLKIPHSLNQVNEQVFDKLKKIEEQKNLDFYISDALWSLYHLSLNADLNLDYDPTDNVYDYLALATNIIEQINKL